MRAIYVTPSAGQPFSFIACNSLQASCTDHQYLQRLYFEITIYITPVQHNVSAMAVSCNWSGMHLQVGEAAKRSMVAPIADCLRAQGVKGPPFFPIVGNQPELVRLLAEAGSKPMKSSSNEIVPRILPHYTKWSKIYGETLIYTFGSEVRLTTINPELIKEILGNKLGHFPNVTGTPAIRDLFGDGLSMSNGQKWGHQRRILNSGFHVDKLKVW
ncbi:hypothetical protein O6H91_14G075100 [Diphasiastrum complanatum]|uniref:Uncharacterized protein n=1 Tax=Diphasiastrum complanatum TaxID=34168 RepID=A0ACC2BQY7_DIPCM|nr:hypothetical protein O6H91_14G075100 [Diphasiastrum complanatum]